MLRVLDATRKSTRAKALAKTFANKIVGQDAAREALENLIEKYASGMYNKKKPIGSLLFLGPTGSGKTLVAEVFTEGLFKLSDKMLKVDCAEFQHSHEIAKLIGSPPGYLGHRETHPYFTNARLIEARSDAKGVEIHPFTVILFDEIEKASDALWNLLLGILDKGSLTLGTNEKVDFTKTIIIMTSNVGAVELSGDNNLGFAAEEKVLDDAKMEEIARGAARKKFMPEFLNRLDHIVNFKSLTKGDLETILTMELEQVQQRIVWDSKVVFELRVGNRGLEQLLKAGYDRRYNARHLVRAIDQFITTPLTRMIATDQILDNDIVVANYSAEEDKWRFVAAQKAEYHSV